MGFIVRSPAIAAFVVFLDLFGFLIFNSLPSSLCIIVNLKDLKNRDSADDYIPEYITAIPQNGKANTANGNI